MKINDVHGWERLSESGKSDWLAQSIADRIVKGSKHHLRYEEVLNDIAITRLEKCRLYGEDRYEGNDFEFNSWMCFSDVYRKFIRLKQLTKLVNQESGEENIGAYDALKDAYLDIANYGISGYQILTEHENDKN